MLGSFVAALALALGLPAAGTVESRQALPSSPVTVTVTSYPSAHGSLYGIAKNLCGNGDRWKEIATANHVTWLIYPGQRLKVPCAKGAASSRVATAAKPNPSTNTSRAAKVVAFAKAQIGDWYLWGAAGPSRWDCSGLVMVAFRQVGVRLPHQSDAMKAYGRHVSRANLHVGDIVWPQNGHVAIYLGNNMMIASPHSGAQVRVQKLYGFYMARRVI
jgi:cell wall-associated NlpC family hydrolase